MLKLVRSLPMSSESVKSQLDAADSPIKKRKSRRFALSAILLPIAAMFAAWISLGTEQMIYWVGKFHPPLTHFPIAMLCAAALGEGLYLALKNESYRVAARFSLWLGMLGTVAAVGSGWLCGGFAVTDGDWVMTWHRWLGTATGAITFVVLGACELMVRSDSPRLSNIYRSLLMASSMLVTATGFLGGCLIYGVDHYFA